MLLQYETGMKLTKLAFRSFSVPIVVLVNPDTLIFCCKVFC